MKNEDTKERIIREALRLFSVNGYEAVSVEEIGAAVGIKAPSLYKHYKGKKDIFDHIVLRMNERCEEAEKEIDISDDRIAECAKALFAHWTKDEFAIRFRKLLSIERYHDEEMAKLYDQYFLSGPVEKISELFALSSESKAEAKSLATEFYGPIFLMYSMSDDAKDKKELSVILDEHIEKYLKRLKKDSKKQRKEAKKLEAEDYKKMVKEKDDLPKSKKNKGKKNRK